MSNTAGRKVFISHSSKDFEFASRLCSVFEQHGMPCWIAPRDIPCGAVWSEEITQAIENSKMMILIFSEHSNQSPQVVREINLAEQQGIPIFAVKLSEQEYNRALKYYLSIHHWISLQYDADDRSLISFAGDVKDFLSGERIEFAPSPDDIIELSDVNIDAELEAKFAELFDVDEEHREVVECRPQEDVSPFRKKLLDRIVSRFTSEIFVPVDDEDEEDEEAGESGEQAAPEDEEETGDKYFCISEKEGKTLAFLVRRRISEADFSESYYAEQLEKSAEQTDSGQKATFFLNRISHGGNPLVTVTCLENSDVLLMNMGFVSGDQIKISNRPMPMTVTNIIETAQKPTRYMLNPQCAIVIIDPQTAEVVPRKQCYDRQKRKTMHYIDLLINKRYLAFNLRAESTKGSAAPRTASALTIADAYYYGEDGLSKNILKAAEWYEKDGSAESLLRLSEIFTNDPLLSDPDDAAYYKKLHDEALRREQS